MAEGVFSDMVRKADRLDEFYIESAGTGAWHAGDPPDPRAISTLASNDIDISNQRSRPIEAQDFERFDLILAMDRRNLRDVAGRYPAAELQKTKLFMQYALQKDVDVPDPYTGAQDGFDLVYKMLVEGCATLLTKLGSAKAGFNG